ncbi:MAG: Cof-type HAD-IIB family hydrolase [Anaerostipes sp.]|nr:Cof-type HAD-IIB family hydrolase [Anaerostipes sp.]
MANLKAVFSDIDGTLLNTKHEVSKDTKEVIQEIMKHGIPFVLVSARMPKGMISIRDEIKAHYPMICYSGALIVDADGNDLFSCNFKQSTAKNIYKSLRKYSTDISINIYSENRWIVEDKEEKWAKQESEITGVIPEEINFENKEVFTCVHKYLCMGEPEEINKVENFLKVEYPEVRIYKSKPTYLEIMTMEASKSNAIRLLEDYFHIQKEETIAFGDGFNDIDMISYAGVGVAMGNAADEVKEVADIVADTNENEGLMKVLYHQFSTIKEQR